MGHIPKRILITGITGSGGSYFAEYIVQNHPEIEIHGLARWHSTSSHKNLFNIEQKITVHECDLNDLSSAFDLMRRVQPDTIFHFASHANVLTSFITPLSVVNNNVMSTLNLLEAIRLVGHDPFLQICSTSEVYGQVGPQDVPIKEDCPMRPVSPYAVSKVTQDLLGFAYWRSYKMKIIRTRMFAYLNPRRPDLFAASFARQVARVEQGLQKELLHGNLDSVRTLIDVRDAVEAYWLSILHCEPGEVYNIGGLTVMTVGDFLNVLKKLSNVPIPSRVDPQLLRPADVTLQVPCVDKFTKATGWKPKYSIEESIQHLLDHCRREVSNETRQKEVIQFS